MNITLHFDTEMTIGIFVRIRELEIRITYELQLIWLLFSVTYFWYSRDKLHAESPA